MRTQRLNWLSVRSHKRLFPNPQSHALFSLPPFALSFYNEPHPSTFHASHPCVTKKSVSNPSHTRCPRRSSRRPDRGAIGTALPAVEIARGTIGNDVGHLPNGDSGRRACCLARKAWKRPKKPSASRASTGDTSAPDSWLGLPRLSRTGPACGVHHDLNLPDRCAVYDVSNACLGLLSGMVQVANMIELGQIRAGVVVGTESSRSLVETTIDHLNADVSLSHQDIKAAFASLTIGSGSTAIVLVRWELSRTGNHLLGGVMRTATEHCELCQGGGTKAADSHSQPLDVVPISESLMPRAWPRPDRLSPLFWKKCGWTAGDIQKTFCHQVGRAHHKLLFESLGLDQAIDYTTLEYLGNTGSTALPMTAAIGIENGRLQKDDRVALLGIGSGINVVMLGVDWQRNSQILD